MKLKVTTPAWIGSVPPAVAGGYVVDTIGLNKAAHPPATAGGTDPTQVGRIFSMRGGTVLLVRLRPLDGNLKL